MTRNEYLYILRKNLQSLPIDEIDDIINDVASHFDFGVEEGKSEEEVSKQLGDPVDMARQFIGVTPKQQSYAYTQPSKSSIPSWLKTLITVFAVLFLAPLILSIYLLILSFILLGICLIIAAVLLLLAPVLAPLAPAFVSMPLSFANVVLLVLGFSLLGVGTAWLSVFAFRGFTVLIRKGYSSLSLSLEAL
ncbi:DUF1700 domain-containing protein [Erysipelothrix anatis]|uniref:DUF1700 domain-containing protein n=1 Tax=Erysipelothrix anatis TaxID=2683713 RepID=UPI00135A96AB|nr:DUF1700 domain-containing protein [Erysipelothrix anatis]